MRCGLFGRSGLAERPPPEFLTRGAAAPAADGGAVAVAEEVDMLIELDAAWAFSAWVFSAWMFYSATIFWKFLIGFEDVFRRRTTRNIWRNGGELREYEKTQEQRFKFLSKTKRKNQRKLQIHRNWSSFRLVLPTSGSWKNKFISHLKITAPNDTIRTSNTASVPPTRLGVRFPLVLKSAPVPPPP